MSDVLVAEAWPGAGPRGLVYLVDTVTDDGGDPGADVRAWLAARRLDAAAPPYVRVNAEPWERYVLTLPGSTRNRLRVDQSGLSNLWLAGDWVWSTVNGGSVEAAFETGCAAAEAIRAEVSQGAAVHSASRCRRDIMGPCNGRAAWR